MKQFFFLLFFIFFDKNFSVKSQVNQNQWRMLWSVLDISVRIVLNPTLDQEFPFPTCGTGKKWASTTVTLCNRGKREENATVWPMLGRRFSGAESTTQHRYLSLVPILLAVSEALSFPPIPLMSLLASSRLRIGKQGIGTEKIPNRYLALKLPWEARSTVHPLPWFPPPGSEFFQRNGEESSSLDMHYKICSWS